MSQTPDDHFYALRDALFSRTAAEAIAWYKALSADDQEIVATVARTHRVASRTASYPPVGVGELGAYLEWVAAEASRAERGTAVYDIVNPEEE